MLAEFRRRRLLGIAALGIVRGGFSGAGPENSSCGSLGHWRDCDPPVAAAMTLVSASDCGLAVDHATALSTTGTLTAAATGPSEDSAVATGVPSHPTLTSGSSRTRGRRATSRCMQNCQAGYRVRLPVPVPLSHDTNPTEATDYTLVSPLSTITISAERTTGMQSKMNGLAQAPAASAVKSNGVSPTIPSWRLIDCTQRHSSPTAVRRPLPEEASEPFCRRATGPRASSNS